VFIKQNYDENCSMLLTLDIILIAEAPILEGLQGY